MVLLLDVEKEEGDKIWPMRPFLFAEARRDVVFVLYLWAFNGKAKLAIDGVQPGKFSLTHF